MTTMDPATDVAFDPTQKKKKKKKVVLDIDDEPTPAKQEDVPVAVASEVTAPDGVKLEAEPIDFGKKKKKKPTKIADIEGDAGTTADGVTLADGGVIEPDYTYEQLLNRVYDIMREKNPEMATGDKKRFVMKPPQVLRVGTKKTAFANFSEMCKLLKRTPKHLLAFLLAELGTSGSIDGNNSLIIKGKFQQKHIESVLRKYIKEYVTCHTCKSADTVLQKDTRLFFLQCGTCGSRCSVASIKSGFQAITTKRAHTRAAAQT